MKSEQKSIHLALPIRHARLGPHREVLLSNAQFDGGPTTAGKIPAAASHEYNPSISAGRQSGVVEWRHVC